MTACLTFRAAGKRYALPIDHVREAARARGVTPLPGASPAVAGVALVRGEPIGVVTFGDAGGEPGAARFLVVLEDRPFALLVDTLDGVEMLAEGEHDPRLLDLDALLGSRSVGGRSL